MRQPGRPVPDDRHGEACGIRDAVRRGVAPLTIGETFTIRSHALGEERRINVYVPPRHGADTAAPLPVLYVPDGGIVEDFLHVAGLVQVSIANGTMRPCLLVGIENTDRRRDLTGPTRRAVARDDLPSGRAVCLPHTRRARAGTPTREGT